MAMQSILQELRTLKQDEMTLINLASKISDQLNRLKVEELALQNMVRLQNEEQERLARVTDRSFLSSNAGEMLGSGSEDEEVELDLNVGILGRAWDSQEQEEEEEEEDIQNDPNDIEEFVERLV